MHKKLLGGNALRHGRELVKEDSLMGRMLVDNVKPLEVLCDDIALVHLPDGQNAPFIGKSVILCGREYPFPSLHYLIRLFIQCR